MMTTRQRQSTSHGRPPAWLWLLYICDVGLLIASGLIHLHLWDIAYRHVKTLDVLFLVQTIAALLLAVLLLVTGRLLVVLAGILLMIGTIVGFILADTVGIFGFKLPYVTGLAQTVLIVEIAAIVMLAVTAWTMRRTS
jgi:hypothetical protein